MKRKPIRVFEGFAGYGGACFGLKRSGIPFEVVGYSENDKFAIELFDKNHPGIRNFGDITKISPEELPDFDLFTGGFPCQPFSSAGKGLGELDIRGTLFYDILRICKVKKPEHILLENVKGLTTGRHRPTFMKILSDLKALGYQVHHAILNSKDYGIPQNRERLWIYATLTPRSESWVISPEKRPLTKFFKDYLDENPEKSLFKNKSQVDRIIEKHKVDLHVPEPLCLDIYNKKIRTDRISITITEPHHNCLRVVHPPKNGEFIVRKLSVTEHFRLMGFKDGEIKLNGQSYQQLCKRAGNGWDVNLVTILIKHIFEQMI